MREWKAWLKLISLIVAIIGGLLATHGVWKDHESLVAWGGLLLILGVAGFMNINPEKGKGE